MGHFNSFNHYPRRRRRNNYHVVRIKSHTSMKNAFGESLGAGLGLAIAVVVAVVILATVLR